MSIDIQDDNSGDVLSSDVEGDQGGQAECGKAEINGVSPRMF